MLSAVLLLVLVGGVSSALATGLPLVSPYGEVGHFGGYAAPTSGHAELGKFDYPVGFAVAPKEADGEENDVYVLDRVLDEENGAGPGKLGYRLQKLTSSGTPIASVTLPVEEFASRIEAHPLVSLAVDPAKGRVYAVVESIVESGEEGEGEVPVAQRLVAWNTKPSGTTLEKATGYTSEDSSTHAALVAEFPTSELGKDLYSPQGITIAKEVSGKGDNVVVEAQQGVSNAKGGPTILQQVETEGTKGALGGSWVAGSEGDVAPHSQQADGVFAADEGSSFGLDLYEERGKISRLAGVDANFQDPSPSLLAEDTSGGKNLDEAPSIDTRYTVNYHGEESDERILVPYAAGSPITQLTNGLYAARYALAGRFNNPQSEVKPWYEGTQLESFWWQGESGADKSVGNVGIRVFGEKGEVVGTIGGQPAPPCRIETSAISLAAGSGEALFVLTQPDEENGDSGDEVIEFKPGGEGVCPQSSGGVEVTVAGQEKDVKPGEEVAVGQHVPVAFDAFSSVDRAGETPFAFEWNYGELGKGYEVEPEGQIEAGNGYLWPQPTATHTYSTPGEYHASMRLVGDYGAKEFPFVIKVAGTNSPVAEFTAPASVTLGQAVKFDAKASKPTEFSSITAYEWEFGDGSKKITAGPEVEHPYGSTGEFTVSLTVRDEGVKLSSTPVKHKVKVEAAPVACVAGCPATECGSTCPPPQESPPVSPITKTVTPVTPVTPVVKKPLTNAQELAKALKACTKEPKKRRAGCVKQAEKKYAPKKKSKTKKKK
jgi:PKD repeat protein